MTFDVAEYHALVKLLYEHPEWRAEMRQLLLSEEILTLPAVVRELSVIVKELAEAQKRTEQRVEELTEAQKRTDEQLRLLTQRVDALTEAQRELTKAQERTERRVEGLVTRVGELSGYLLEGRYRQRPLSYFNRLLSRAEAVDVVDVLPAEMELSEEALEDLLALDVLIRGQLKPRFAERLGFSRVWLVVEISGQIEYSDVERTWERAMLLQKCGLPTIGVVGGKGITQNALDVAQSKGVIVQLERQLMYVDEALNYLQRQAE